MKLAILTPTRDRPASVHRLLDSIGNTTSEAERSKISVRFYVDDDDQVMLQELAKMGISCSPGGFSNHFNGVHAHFEVASNVILSKCWNELWKGCRSDFDLFMLSGDDLVFRTPGWYGRVVSEFKKFPDRILVLGCDDGHWKPTAEGKADLTLTHAFVSREWTDVLGYFVPELFSAYYNDNWLTQLGDFVGRKVWLRDVLIEHMHYCFGKSKVDATYRRQIGGGGKNYKIFVGTRDDRLEGAEKLKMYIQEHS